MYEYAPTVEQLIRMLRRLPGIGTKSGQRIIAHLLKTDEKYVHDLATSLVELREKVFHCPTCFNITDTDPCRICSDQTRDNTIICIVENPYEIIPIEKSGFFKGRFHVLLGVLSPIDGITPADLKIRELLERIKDGNIEEVIIATNPSVEGESTAHYLAGIIKPLGIKVSRIGMGIPVGGDIEYADENTMVKALSGRLEI